MEIIRAELADVERLAELNKCLIEDERHPNPMDVAQLTQRMKEWLATGYICYLVKENRRIIAYCLFRDDGEHYYTRQLYVSRAHRRKGIATQLLDWLYENAWTDKKVRLDATHLGSLAASMPTSFLGQKISRAQYRNVLK